MDLLPHLLTLVMLVLLQAVLGFDNLLYISRESKRAPADQQSRVRMIGIKNLALSSCTQEILREVYRCCIL